MTINLSVIGLGVVGNAIFETLKEKYDYVTGYDKFKNGGIGRIEDCLKSDIIFQKEFTENLLGMIKVLAEAMVPITVTQSPLI